MAGSQFTKDIDVEEDYELYKIVVVGDAQTSKSSMLKRLANDPLSQYTDEYKNTIGVEFVHKDLLVEAKKIKLQIWDTAGQERFKALSRGYYRGAKAYVVTYDITRSETFDHVANWIHEVREHGEPGVPIFVVGTKADLTALRKVSLTDAASLAADLSTDQSPVIACPEVSAKNNEGIEGLFTKVAKEVYKHLRTALASDASDEKPVVVRDEIPSDEESGEEALPITSKPSIWNPWRNTRGKVASAVTAALCVAGVALFIIFFPHVFATAALVTLITMGVCALVGGGALTYAAGLIAENYCGCQPSTGEEGEALLITGNTYSDLLYRSGLYESGTGSGLPGPLENSEDHRGVVMDETYKFAGSSSGLGLPPATPYVPPVRSPKLGSSDD